jgi:hypothetical protein
VADDNVAVWKLLTHLLDEILRVPLTRLIVLSDEFGRHHASRNSTDSQQCSRNWNCNLSSTHLGSLNPSHSAVSLSTLSHNTRLGSLGSFCR